MDFLGQDFKLNQPYCFDLRAVLILKAFAAIVMKFDFVVDFFVCFMDFGKCSDYFKECFIKEIDFRLKTTFNFDLLRLEYYSISGHSISFSTYHCQSYQKRL